MDRDMEIEERREENETVLTSFLAGR